MGDKNHNAKVQKNPIQNTKFKKKIKLKPIRVGGGYDLPPNTPQRIPPNMLAGLRSRSFACRIRSALEKFTSERMRRDFFCRFAGANRADAQQFPDGFARPRVSGPLGLFYKTVGLVIRIL